jgi:peptidoglycan/xylan/chitin deacetylase (PgdA/CDA1 family)
MRRPLTVVTYHYVRDLERSRYPEINGLKTGAFRDQIAHIQQQYTVISGEHLIAAVTGDGELPSQPALLTFDDGYLDHFTTAFPILDDAGLTGCFFPPARCILDRKMLDVNKIHYFLASVSDTDKIENDLFNLMKAWGESFDLPSRASYRAKVAGNHRFDDPQVVLIKRLLQRELPDPLRSRIVDQLFQRYVDVSEEVLVEELYMTLDQLRCMRRHGMYIGSHGDQHDWMDRLNSEEQQAEVDRSLSLLEKVGIATDRWIMCYPYGAHDASLRKHVHAQGGVVGLTTRAEVANLEQDDPLALPRLDTNDVPTGPAGAT